MIKQIFPKQEIFFFVVIISLLSGCFEPFNQELVSTQTIQVPPYKVTEVINRIDAWPDPVFERRYAFDFEDTNFSHYYFLGRYTNEGSEGITIQPMVVDLKLIVFSTSYVFVMDPGGPPIELNPYEAEGWSEYAQTHQLNGHYDYIATDFWESGSNWLIAYDCVFCQDGKPEKLLFYSNDEGKSFTLCRPSVHDQLCLDNE
ncbi:MAG: hypothetical protein AAF902_17410 [Chloroflexota bacterium]